MLYTLNKKLVPLTRCKVGTTQEDSIGIGKTKSLHDAYTQFAQPRRSRAEKV